MGFDFLKTQLGETEDGVHHLLGELFHRLDVFDCLGLQLRRFRIIRLDLGRLLRRRRAPAGSAPTASKRLLPSAQGKDPSASTHSPHLHGAQDSSFLTGVHDGGSGRGFKTRVQGQGVQDEGSGRGGFRTRTGRGFTRSFARGQSHTVSRTDNNLPQIHPMTERMRATSDEPRTPAASS